MKKKAEALQSRGISRLNFLKTIGGAAGTAVAGMALASTRAVAAAAADAPSKSAVGPGSPLWKEGGDDLLRMQDELARALSKPIAKRDWAMVIDIRKCIGCNACTVACIAENNLPPGVAYRAVYDETAGEYPKLKRFFMPTNCYQCANPPCVKAANAVKADSMGVRPDGIVTIDYAKMKAKDAFAAAKKACPYGDALSYDNGGNYTDGTPAVQPYEKRESVEYDRALRRADTAGGTRKCHFCIQRIERGALPACVATCTGQAMHFGDRSDPDSLVSGLIARKQQTFVMEQGAGTEPRVIYLDNEPMNAKMSCAKCHQGGNVK